MVSPGNFMLFLHFSGDPQKMLHTLVQKGRVDLFEVTQPSLHDIFIRIAGAPMEAEDQAGRQAADSGGRRRRRKGRHLQGVRWRAAPAHRIRAGPRRRM